MSSRFVVFVALAGRITETSSAPFRFSQAPIYFEDPRVGVTFDGVTNRITAYTGDDEWAYLP